MVDWGCIRGHFTGFCPLERILQSILSLLKSWEGIQEGPSPCFIYHRNAQKGTVGAFCWKSGHSSVLAKLGHDASSGVRRGERQILSQIPSASQGSSFILSPHPTHPIPVPHVRLRCTSSSDSLLGRRSDSHSALHATPFRGTREPRPSSFQDREWI